jgi:hypothetical protein
MSGKLVKAYEAELRVWMIVGDLSAEVDQLRAALRALCDHADATILNGWRNNVLLDECRRLSTQNANETETEQTQKPPSKIGG